MSASRPSHRNERYSSSRIRDELRRAAAMLQLDGSPTPELEGQLIRPRMCVAGLGSSEPPEGFWSGALAVQLAHEASLCHDDILDLAPTRRNRATIIASGGAAKAVLLGDHLLTAAYRAAASTNSLEFVSLFSRAVERMVAGEKLQGESAGRRLQRAEYERIVLGKSGELLGCALATAAALLRRPDIGELFELGRRTGMLYQMLDDLLDYCPAADTGKPALADYKSGRWTWVLERLPEVPFGLSGADLLWALHASSKFSHRMYGLARELRVEGDRLLQDYRNSAADSSEIEDLVQSWVRRGCEAVRRERAIRSTAVRTLAAAVPDSAVQPATAGPESPDLATMALQERAPPLGRIGEYQARNSRSFRFASRFFESRDRGRITRVYAYCRVVDDLVDRPPGFIAPETVLQRWMDLSWKSYVGHTSGIPLIDHVMREMADAGIPFQLAAELAEGMRMDLRGDRYESLEDLRRYTYRVAGVVGVWLTRLSGFDNPGVLAQAERMGHAMQLTNIVRDVGEDLRSGRMYIPRDLLVRHGLGEDDLLRATFGGPIPAGYPTLVEELMQVAEADYEAGLDALHSLPRSFARPVAVAAHVYRGIHEDVRRHACDNLRFRAHTSVLEKSILAGRALRQLYRPARIPPANLATATAIAGRIRGTVRAAVRRP